MEHKKENVMHYSYMAYQIHVTYSFAREMFSSDMCIAIVLPIIQDIALLRYVKVMPADAKKHSYTSGIHVSFNPTFLQFSSKRKKNATHSY